jgi:Tfp pilus assembly protein PilO
MSEHLYLLTICLVLGTILLVFGMRYFAALQQAKARLANGEAYRQIAEKAVAVQSENAASLSSIQEALADVRSRMAAVEKILKQVE